MTSDWRVATLRLTVPIPAAVVMLVAGGYARYELVNEIDVPGWTLW